MFRRDNSTRALNIVTRSYKYRIYPDSIARTRIDTTIETCRRLYNRFLWNRCIPLRRRYGIIVDKNGEYHNLPVVMSSEHSIPLVPIVMESRIDQQHYLRNAKLLDKFLGIVYSTVLIDVVARVDAAMNGMFTRISNNGSSGKKPSGNKNSIGVPTLRGRRDYNSFTYPGTSGYKLVGDRLIVAKLGCDKIEGLNDASSMKIVLHRPIEGKIKTLTIKREFGKYYAIFSCECERKVVDLTGKHTGIDLGLKHYLVTSDGHYEDPMYPFKREQRLIAQLQRARSKKVRGSSRYKELNRTIAKIHARIARRREHVLRNVAACLVNNYDTIYYEDLNIAGMAMNKHLSKAIYNAGWRSFLNYLDNKCSGIEGKYSIPVDPMNTSQLCSRCGNKVPKRLHQRVHRCSCGMEIDRDLNAAINVLKKGAGDEAVYSILQNYEATHSTISS